MMSGTLQPQAHRHIGQRTNQQDDADIPPPIAKHRHLLKPSGMFRLPEPEAEPEASEYAADVGTRITKLTILRRPRHSLVTEVMHAVRQKNTLCGVLQEEITRLTTQLQKLSYPTTDILRTIEHHVMKATYWWNACIEPQNSTGTMRLRIIQTQKILAQRSFEHAIQIASDAIEACELRFHVQTDSLLLHIFQYLPVDALATARDCCPAWQTLIDGHIDQLTDRYSWWSFHITQHTSHPPPTYATNTDIYWRMVTLAHAHPAINHLLIEQEVRRGVGCFWRPEGRAEELAQFQQSNINILSVYCLSGISSSSSSSPDDDPTMLLRPYGHCMNILSGAILSCVGDNEPQALEIFTALMQSYNVAAHFVSPDMYGVKARADELSAHMQVHLPTLAMHLTRYGITPLHFVTPWILGMFLNIKHMTVSIGISILNGIFLHHGPKTKHHCPWDFMIQLQVAVLSYYESELLQLKSTNMLLQRLAGITKQLNGPFVQTLVDTVLSHDQRMTEQQPHQLSNNRNTD